MAEKPVDYYAVLEVSPGATQEEIRTAYKKAALRWHPDRVPSDSPERAKRTKKFQQVNDAYFTLSDPARRRDYDAARQWSTGDTESEYADEEIPRPHAKKGGFASWFGFGGEEQPNYEQQQWGSAFEEMMRDAEMGKEQEGEDGKTRTVGHGRFWMLAGGISGATTGFIVGNFWGAAIGASAGAKLGNIRDIHGTSVYEVFQALPQADKAKVLSELAAKIFAQVVSG